VKLKTKILLLTIGVLVVAMGGLSLPLYWYTRSALEEELEHHLQTVLKIGVREVDTSLLAPLSGEPGLSSLRSQLRNELEGYVTGSVKGIALLGPDGRELVSAGDRPASGGMYSGLITADSLSGSSSGVEFSEIYSPEDGRYYKTAGMAIHGQHGILGYLVLHSSVPFMGLMDQLAGSILWIGIIAVAAAIGLTLAFSRSLLIPVSRLASYTRAIQENLNTAPVILDRKDEFADLSKALRDMHLELRENEERNRQLLSGIAHEIKNPLGGMEIYAGLLEEELDEDEEPAEYLEKITNELGNLRQIVTAYLDYSRPPRAEISRVSVTEVVEDIRRLLEPELRQMGAEFNYTGEAVVMADRTRLRRILLNLLRNSLEAVPENSGQIKVASETVEEMVLIEVADNGRGISKEEQENIFEPYYTTRDKGYGLGLAIVQRMVEEMNGTIFVTSEAGTGTTFEIHLPEGEVREET